MENLKLIVSLYDYSGNWPEWYIKNGYAVILWDYKKEVCILQHFNRLLMAIDEAMEAGYKPYGLMAAPPCTDISSAGAQFWAAKDVTPAPEPYYPWTLTEQSTGLVEIVLLLVELFPWSFWVVENPPGRMETLCPDIAKYRALMFQPWQFGDDMTKRTVLWGQFNTDLQKTPIKPTTVKIKTRDRYYNSNPLWATTGGKSGKTKAIRSNTPRGFAKQFYLANQ
jgi:site-specific DNA-cytosine methylase